MRLDYLCTFELEYLDYEACRTVREPVGSGLGSRSGQIHRRSLERPGAMVQPPQHGK
jgi:hypothetical protein